MNDLNNLLVFVDEGSVSKAAKVLNMSQPALSRRLKVFQHTGAKPKAVLQTNGHSVVLTPTGERALPAMRDLLRQYDQLIKFLFKHATAPQVVRLGLGTFSAQYYLPRVLARLGSACGETFDLKTELMRGKQRIEHVAGCLTPRLAAQKWELLNPPFITLLR